jgi:transposase-like protein
LRQLDPEETMFSPHEKVAVVKRHLLARVPISAIREICEELKISPNMFYRWPQELFENAHLSFETDRKRRLSRQPRIAGSQQQPDCRSQDRKTSLPTTSAPFARLRSRSDNRR